MAAAQGGRRKRSGAGAPARRAHARAHERGSARASVRPPKAPSRTTSARLRLNARAPQPGRRPGAPQASARRPAGCVGGVRATRGARSEVSRSERPSDARSAELGEPMPARLRVRRRSLNAPRARRSLPGCLRPFGAAGFSPPTSRLRLRGVRATRGARSEEITCARHRRHAMVSRASFAFPRREGARQSGDRASVRGVNAGPSPHPRVPISIW